MEKCVLARKAGKQIPLAYPALTGNERKYVTECIETSWVSSVGRFVPLFEAEFARFCETRHAVTCNNGTSALHLALLGLGVGPGDEVIVPTLTYIATANAVRYCGAKPVFVDSEPLTMNLDPSAVEGLITPRTKGILAVHLYGHPADMDAINAIAAQHNLFVVEDAAEAHGALYKGRKAGSLGNAATFSFYGNKIITTGEGGMVTTDDPDLDARMRLYRGQGMDPNRRYWFPVTGYNYRMTNIQAAIGLAQLEEIDTQLEKRQQVARWYDEHLADLQDFVQLPRQAEWAQHSFWMYTLILEDRVALTRDGFMHRLGEAGIETRPVFYPMHILPPYLAEGAGGAFPVADHLGARGFNVPTHGLLEEGDIAYIANEIRNICHQ